MRALELAEAGASLAPTRDRLWAGETRHPTVVVGLDVPKVVLDQRIAERTRAMFEAGVQDEVQRALSGPISTTARKTMGIDEVAERSRLVEARVALVARPRYAAYQRKWMRRVPAPSSTATARWARSPMTSSRWHAQGNVYLVSEDGALTPELVREQAQGTDGIVQVVRAGDDVLEIVIWNTDGSTAEMSGNGTRIAGAWLMARSGATDVRVVVGPRRSPYVRSAPPSTIRELGAVEVGEARRRRYRADPVYGATRTRSSSAIRTT